MPIPQFPILVSVLLQLLSDEKSYTIRTLTNELTNKFPLEKNDLKGFEIQVNATIQDLKDRALIKVNGDSVKISDLGLQNLEEGEDMQAEEEEMADEE